MNADEVVAALRNCKAYKTKSDLQIAMIRAADLIESPQAQLTKVQRERDAAVEDILCDDHCEACKFSEDDSGCEKYDYDCLICMSDKCECRSYRDENKWKWRGVEKGDGNALQNK